jgi:hypothetical protein
MKSRCAVAVLAVAILSLCGCDNYDFVDKTQVVKKSDLKEYVIVNKDDLEKLKAEAATARRIGRFQLYARGFRTWRLDTSTGDSCLVLTIESDWKTKEAQLSQCPFTMPEKPNEVAVRTLQP